MAKALTCPTWYAQASWDKLNEDERSWVVANKAEAMQQLAAEIVQSAKPVEPAAETDDTADAVTFAEDTKAFHDAAAETAKAITEPVKALMNECMDIAQRAGNHSILRIACVIPDVPGWPDALPDVGKSGGNNPDIYFVPRYSKKGKRLVKKTTGEWNDQECSVIEDIFDAGFGASIVAEITRLSDKANVPDMAEHERKTFSDGMKDRLRKGRNYFREAVKFAKQWKAFQELTAVGCDFQRYHDGPNKGEIVLSTSPIVTYAVDWVRGVHPKTKEATLSAQHSAHQPCAVSEFLSYNLDKAQELAGMDDAGKPKEISIANIRNSMPAKKPATPETPDAKGNKGGGTNAEGLETKVRNIPQAEVVMSELAHLFLTADNVTAFFTELNREDDALFISTRTVFRILSRYYSGGDQRKRSETIDAQLGAVKATGQQ